MTNEFVVIGAGGHGKVIIEIIEATGGTVSYVNDADPSLTTVLGYKVSTNEPSAQQNAVIAVGNNRIRKKIASRLECMFVAAIHPSATLSPRCVIGEGTVVMAGATINADVRLGKHCIVNTNASIDHDCVIGDYAHISPGVSLAGGVQVGEGTQVGIGASVIPGVRIGKWAVIGAGAAIIEDVPDNAIVTGVPGKVLRYNEPED